MSILDIAGTFAKHYSAPRALTQEAVNSKFLGTPWEIAERYTTVTKLLFLCFFYAALYPAGHPFALSPAHLLSHLLSELSELCPWGCSVAQLATQPGVAYALQAHSISVLY